MSFLGFGVSFWIFDLQLFEHYSIRQLIANEKASLASLLDEE